MKKLFILLLAVAATATATQAQVVSMGDDDTITNTDADTVSKNLKVGLNANVSIQVIINRLSGTAAGTAIVYGAISNGDTVMYVPTGDTLAFTNVAVQSKVFDYPTGKYSHYRVIYTSSGTTSLRARAWLYARKTE